MAKGHSKIKRTQEQKQAILEAKKLGAKASTKKSVKPVTKREGKPGRPTILTDELIKKVSTLILAGAYIETACAACGFAKQLYFEWLKLGNKRSDLELALTNAETDEQVDEIERAISQIDPIYQQFTDSIKKAVVEGEIRDLMRVDQAAVKSWQAAAWKLERKHPERWSRKERVEHSGEVKTDISIDKTRSAILDLMQDPESLMLAEKLIDRMGKPRE